MTDYEETVESISRRSVLQGIGGASAGLVAVGATTSPAAAGKGGDCDPDGDPARIDTSDHYDTTWYGSVSLTDGHSEDGYDEAGGDLPAEPDELLVHVHGFENDEECGIDRIETTRVSETHASHSTSTSSRCSFRKTPSGSNCCRISWNSSQRGYSDASSLAVFE